MSAVILAALVSALLIIGGHWFPWRLMLHRDLHRIEAYTYGVASILIPACAVLAWWGAWDAVTVVTSCALAAGVTTVASKLVDLVIEFRNAAHDAREREDAARRAVNQGD